MDAISVCHEPRRQGDDVEPDHGTFEIHVEIYVLPRVSLIAMRVEISRDAAVSSGELRVQVYESDAKLLRERSADGVPRRTPAPSATTKKMNCEVRRPAASAPTVMADRSTRAGIGRMDA